MAKKPVLKEFEVAVFIKLWTSIKVKSDSMAGALEIAKTMKESQFIKVVGEHIDSTMCLSGISDYDVVQL